MNDNDMTNTGGSVNRGSTALPKFNHLYPILFFSQFIRLCGANKCGGPLSSPDGHIDSIITLEESGAERDADMPSPSRATVAAEGTPQPPSGRSRGRNRGSHQRMPRPADVSDEDYRAATQDARDRKKRAERFIEDCRAIAGYLAQAVAGDPVGCT